VALERVRFVLGVALLGAVGCARQEPPALPKNDVFVLRYLETHPEALVADHVHPLIAQLQVGLLDVFDAGEDRRLLAIDPRRTAGARTAPLAQRLVDGAPKVDVASSAEPTRIDSDEPHAEEEGETPPPPLSADGRAEVERYLEAYRSALGLGIERAKLVEPALRLFDALVVQAREDARWNVMVRREGRSEVR
jgi:hypothetical protein